MKLTFIQFGALLLMLVFLTVSACMQYHEALRNKRANAVLVMSYEYTK